MAKSDNNNNGNNGNNLFHFLKKKSKNNEFVNDYDFAFTIIYFPNIPWQMINS